MQKLSVERNQHLRNFHNKNFESLWNIWVFPKIGVPQNGWFIMENPIEMDDFGGTTIFGNIHLEDSRQIQFSLQQKPWPNPTDFLAPPLDDFFHPFFPVKKWQPTKGKKHQMKKCFTPIGR